MYLYFNNFLFNAKAINNIILSSKNVFLPVQTNNISRAEAQSQSVIQNYICIISEFAA